MIELAQAPSFRNRVASRRRAAFATGLGALALCLGHAERAAAQADTNPQMPNVLLLVDTSGSMEYKTSSNTFPVCRYDANGLIANPPVSSEKSRWIDLVEILTGTINNYDCQSIDRGSAAFKAEYKVSTAATSPYDFLYPNPYHRPMSGGCVAGPGQQNLLNLADFPANAFNYHVYNNVNTPCTFVQTQDGILDGFQDTIRFGLMTFDTDPSPDQGELGNYSYVVGNSHVGLPAGCVTPSPMEVGARNQSAPPWEGRLVAFGDPSPGSLDYKNKAQQIKQVLRASRPYGATPIAGMLSDARDFLWNDHSMDLVNTTQKFGPAEDPYKDCRDTQIILLTDGQPNMDLRGHCNGSGCPFDLPETIAASLLQGDGLHKPVKTAVIGFALNTLNVAGSNIDCSALSSADIDSTSSSLCSAHPDDPSLQACCTLARIAVNGDSPLNKPHAYFANDRDSLRSDISALLRVPSNTTSRSQAAFATAPSTLSPNDFAASFRFTARFTPESFEPWTGQISRTRWICDKQTHVASQVDLDPNKGDSFDQNLNSGGGRQRTFYTVQAAATGTSVFSNRTIRPNLSTNVDGVSGETGTMSVGSNAATFVSNTSPASMGLTDTSCTNTIGTTVTALTAQQCRDRYLNWLVGLPNGTTYTRCPLGTCSLIGDVFHSTPVVVPAPSEQTHDESYQAYQAAYATRPVMLYASSNDGFLHAFKVASNVKGDTDDITTKKNNELWAFMPPQVLPHVSSQYPFTHQLLLDGVPVVKDVVARKTSGTYPYVFERTSADAQAGLSPSVTWRTILVQSFGAGYPGYFALDISNPDPTMTINSEAGGPKFLWQITTDDAGNPLFGTGGGTPVITTLLFDDDNSGPREIPVAILPGGPGGAGNAGTTGTPGCVRQTSTADLAKFSYPPRQRVPCYTTNLGARSLTVVRLDTGKIIRTFRRSKSEVPTAYQARVIEAPLDSPITGQPVAYPADVGSVTDRIFVGDQDGSIWKADLSNFSPDQWKMSLFWDAFPNVSIHSHPAAGWSDGQPIVNQPVLSVDTAGNITIAVSTGDQNALGAAPNMLNYLWALRDLPDANHVFAADLLWVQQFVGGERVTGPISLFNSYLYFTSVTPPASGLVCASGNANLWGMHYMLPRDGVGTVAQPADRTVGGQAAPFIFGTFGLTGQSVPGSAIFGTSSANQVVLFGATVAQVPTCFDSTDVPTDGYVGGHTQISNLNPGRFQLVLNPGGGAGSTGNVSLNGGKVSSSKDGSVAIDLPSLSTPSHIDAWASIVE